MTMLSTIAERLPDWFLQTAAGQAAEKEAQQAAHATRQRAVELLEAQRRDLHAMDEKHTQLIKPLDAAARAAKAKFEAAEAARVAGLRARVGAVHAIEERIRDLEGDLTRGADPRIDEATREMEMRFDRARHSMVRTQEVGTGRRDLDTLKMVRTMRTNTGAIQRLVRAMREVREGLEALKLQNPVDVGQAIAAVLAPVETAWQTIDTLDDADDASAA